MKTVMAKYKVKTRDCQLIVGVRLSLKEKINVTQLDFFSNRYIRGLLKVKMIKKSHIEYYGPIGISLYERLKKPISKYDFLFIMEQVVDTVQKLNANSLIINNVIFDIKNVFINEISIPFNAPEIMKIIKERKKYIIFDEISNIKTTDIPLSLTRKYSKPLETGDAYLVEDGDVKKIRTIN